MRSMTHFRSLLIFSGCLSMCARVLGRIGGQVLGGVGRLQLYSALGAGSILSFGGRHSHGSRMGVCVLGMQHGL